MLKDEKGAMQQAMQRLQAIVHTHATHALTRATGLVEEVAYKKKQEHQNDPAGRMNRI